MAQLDFVIPVYNEGEDIYLVLNALKSHVKTSFRVLLCYDRDDDNTLSALKSYEAGKLEIGLVRNNSTGPHGAVIAGFKMTAAPAVIMLPADDTYNAQKIDLMVAKFKEGCEIVCASRFMEGGSMRGCPLLKALLVKLAAFTLFHWAKLPTRDATNGFRLFSRRVLDQIPIESTEGYTFSIELLVKCHRLGWKICEVPADWIERTSGQSRFQIIKWLFPYLRWYFYAFSTTFFNRGPKTVGLKSN